MGALGPRLLHNARQFLNEKPIGSFRGNYRRFCAYPDNPFLPGADTQDLWEKNQVAGFDILVFAVGILRPFHGLELEVKGFLALVANGNGAASGGSTQFQARRVDGELPGLRRAKHEQTATQRAQRQSPTGSYHRRDGRSSDVAIPGSI